MSTLHDSPTVSVIVPCYNHSRFLDERLESIFNQTFQDFEVILMDDCSPDDSASILRSYENHPKVSAVIINEKNSGSPFRQWQKGIENAKGKYIWIAESDDSALPNFLSQTVSAMEANPSASIVFTGCECIGTDSEILGNPPADYDRFSHSPSYVEGKSRLYPGVKYARRVLYWYCSVYNASGVLMRRSAFSPEMLEESASMRNSGDWLFWGKMAMKGDVVRIFRKLNRMRIHGNNTTSQGTDNGNRWKEDARVIRRFGELFGIPEYFRKVREGNFFRHISFTPDISESIRPDLVSSLENTFETDWKHVHRYLRWYRRLGHFLPLPPNHCREL